MGEAPADETRRIGLCASCSHARVIQSAKGSSFWMCQRAAEDPRFRKYPPLPVQRCAGHEKMTAADG